MRLLTWNLAWATRASPRGAELLRRITAIQPDVAVLTEVTLPLVEALGGWWAAADGDYGYAADGSRRKVVLWSRTPLRAVDAHGAAGLPGGRFVAAVVGGGGGGGDRGSEPPAGAREGVRVLGVCIPWRDAHVRSGRRDRQPWQDHLDYLAALAPLLAACTSRTVVAGDFNQRNPRHRQPVAVSAALAQAFARWRWLTAGLTDADGAATIDHVVATPDLVATPAQVASRRHAAGTLSDHFGVWCDVAGSRAGRPDAGAPAPGS
jgi:exonuclease III